MKHEFQPYILGKGRAGQALQNAFSILANLEPELGIKPAEFLARGGALPTDPNALLCLTNPSALHAPQILEANKKGIQKIITEKPLCADLKEAKNLSEVKSQIAVLHVYRQLWGPQTIRKLITNGEVGDLITIEGRYWHSSAAEAAIKGKAAHTSGWKNDPTLCGPYDLLLDVGTHWLDMMCFLMGVFPLKNNVWLSYKNSEKPHRDTHLHLNSEFATGQHTLGSISKTTHGMSDHFEFQVVGTKKMLSWNFLNPDEIEVGEGRKKTTMVRLDTEFGSKMPAFRSLGWLEGYIEIARQFIYEAQEKKFNPYPNLASTLPMMESLLQSSISSDKK
ncbi:MAG: Oxidoreductase domain protein [Bacteriovoracaceae bacterium]|nr:Oxidoreductase domain protein [Bacteriovoracaceae bacterium]